MKIGRKEVAYLQTTLKAIMNERVARKTLEAKNRLMKRLPMDP